MTTLNSKSSQAKPPYAPAETLAEVPIALYEIWALARKGQAAEIVPLIESVIRVTEIEPDSLMRLPQTEIPEYLSAVLVS